MDDLKERSRWKETESQPIVEPDFDREHGATPEESALWLETFHELAEAPEIRQALAPNDGLLSDADLADLQRQVDRED
jgi:hypothetical protein